jgi:hypothetical protein
MHVNAVRGEVGAKIGSLDLTLAITMDGLARLSAASGFPTLGELYQRLHGTEVRTVMLALELFTTGGSVDGKKLGKEEAVSQALKRITLSDLSELQGPLSFLMASLLRKSDGESPQGNAKSGQSQ